MTEFELMVLEILIGMEAMEFVWVVVFVASKLKPWFTSRKRHKREVIDDD